MGWECFLSLSCHRALERTDMRIVKRVHPISLTVMVSALLTVSAVPANAFDLPAANAPVCCDESALEALRQGARAYYAGDKAEALDGLQSAAASGHPAAQWKLGRMYANGDGVTEDDLKAFEYFNQIIAAHADDAPTSSQAPFVANAFVEVGSYYLTGIQNSAVRPNVDRAREIFTYAASYFGDALAQVNLGSMYLEGIGGDRDPRQAARWFLLAARKGQIDAQVRLGELLTTGELIEPNPVHGLMWLTVALQRSRALGQLNPEIMAVHEQAFSLASEDVRRKATALAEQWLADNPSVYATAEGPAD
jgi:TPR repeat protein